ncbi:MAG: thiamine diphosphokinase [Elusimicrobia bacterium RIFCSPHIGHO2_02_FULL_57_9]|nr:MAG: thiamine diphosphokinase [Elusimicrobia bacterium RIFCSPHIGHO2_02_FULL_57_9]
MARSPACLILLNGVLPDPGLVRRLARKTSHVLCADGGLRHAASLKLSPRFVIGDMDSLPRPLPHFKKRTTYLCDFDEDRSDFEKTLNFAGEAGFKRIYVAGALGGRTDHMLVNLALIGRYSASLEIIMVDRGFARLLGPGRYDLATLKKGQAFSLLAAPQAKVSLAGAKHVLKNVFLQAGSLGLSNKAASRPHLVIHQGRLWLMSEARS